VTPNKQFEPTVTRRHVRAASAPFHYAFAARWTRGHAAAQLRRYAAGRLRFFTLALAASAFYLSATLRVPAVSQEGLQPVHTYYQQSTVVAVVRITEGRATDNGCGAVYGAAVERVIKGPDISTVTFHDNAGLRIHGRYLIFLAASDSDLSSVLTDEYEKSAYKEMRAECVDAEVPLAALPVQHISVGRTTGPNGFGPLTADTNIRDVDDRQLRGTAVRRDEHYGTEVGYRVDLDALIEYVKNGVDRR
jgi:hypothetical protein